MKTGMKVGMVVAVCVLMAGVAWGQTGAKQLLQKKIEEATQGHRDRTNEQLEQRTEQPMNTSKPANGDAGKAGATQPAIKSGWLFKAAKGDASLRVRMYFSHPVVAKDQKVPGLIVIQEWWGLNEDIQARTRELAQRGFYAVAVDLYDQQVTADPKKAAELKGKLTDEAALVRLRTGLDLLEEEAANGSVDASRVGSIGWCMGGQQSLLLSLADARVKATVVFYGSLVTDAEKLKSLQGPVLGVFGNTDKRPSPEDVNKWEEGLKAAGVKDVTIHRYEGVGHAFASKSAEKMGAYNEEKAKDAFAKTFAWLEEKLGKPKP